MKSSPSSRARRNSFSSILSCWLGQNASRRPKSTETLRDTSARLANADRLLVELLEDRLAPGDALGLVYLMPTSPSAAVTDAATPAVLRAELASPEIVGDDTIDSTQAAAASTDFSISDDLPILSGPLAQDSAAQVPSTSASPVNPPESSTPTQQNDLTDPTTNGWLPEGFSANAPTGGIAASSAAVPSTGNAAVEAGPILSTGQTPASVATGPIASNSAASQQANSLGSLAEVAAPTSGHSGLTPVASGQATTRGDAAQHSVEPLRRSRWPRPLPPADTIRSCLTWTGTTVAAVLPIRSIPRSLEP